MERVKLYTNSEELVTEISVPPWKFPVEVYLWGERFFIRRSDGRYTEADGMFYVPAMIAAKSMPEPEARGQNATHAVLSKEERAKGFVQPVRTKYIHEKCGALTIAGQAISESYARQPDYYSATFCCSCQDYFPVGKDGEFVWDGTGPVVMLKQGDYSGFQKVGT